MKEVATNIPAGSLRDPSVVSIKDCSSDHVRDRIAGVLAGSEADAARSVHFHRECAPSDYPAATRILTRVPREDASVAMAFLNPLARC